MDTVNSSTSSSNTELETDTGAEPTAHSPRYTLLWLATLAATFAIFLGTSEALIRLHVEPNDLLLKHASLMSTSTSANAVFGDSHASLGFTGQPEFVNLAFPGENLRTIASKVEHYFSERSPGKVIFQLGPHQFSERRNSEFGLDYRNADWKPGASRALSAWYRPKVLNFWKVYLTGDEFRVNRALQTDGAQTVDTSLAEMPPSDRRTQAERTVTDQLPAAEPATSTAAQTAKSILSALISRGAEVCLVTFPVAPDQVAYAKRHPEIAATRRYIDELAHSLTLKRVDYWSAIQDYALFTNSDHLNALGASQLASMAVADCGFGQTEG